ncbi:hypothetical protein [Micromonospora sp. NPDC047074]|uniref:hypothetical protein n=1 Tax=Micromonospora sp. NPDC047074 TaxID=3154339 RepID=UPI0033D5D693
MSRFEETSSGRRVRSGNFQIDQDVTDAIRVDPEHRRKLPHVNKRHGSYCNRYRVAARTMSTPDSTSGNTGFRRVADEPGPVR